MEKHTPLISVICSVYNKEQFLRECLQSVLDQTFTDFELICVDDGSTDSSAFILSEFGFKDSRVSVIRQENAGAGPALNAALDAATGAWIAVLDADDILPEDAYESMVQCITENPTVDIVRGDVLAQSHGLRKSMASYRPEGVVYGPVDGTDNDVSHGGLCIWANLYRREFLDNNNIRFNGARGAVYHDVGFFFFTMACAERLINTGRPSYIYRVDEPSSMSHSKNQAGVLEEEFLYVIQKASSPQYKDKFRRVAPSLVKHMAHIALPHAKNRTTTDTYVYTLGKLREALLAAKKAGFDFKLLTASEYSAVSELFVSPDSYVMAAGLRAFLNNQLSATLEQLQSNILQTVDSKLDLVEAASRMKTRQWEHRLFGKRWLWVLLRGGRIEIYCFGRRLIALKPC